MPFVSAGCILGVVVVDDGVLVRVSVFVRQMHGICNFPVGIAEGVCVCGCLQVVTHVCAFKCN